MRFPSGKSASFASLIWGLLALLLACVLIAPADMRIPLAAGCAIAAALLLWIWFGTYYEFLENFLLLRYGPFLERIPYGRITKAKKTKSIASSMALSSDMIELTHGESFITGTTYISPADRDGFLLELAKHCTNLKPEQQ